MEIASSTVDAGMRLMQALEESRMPKGEGLVGSGNRPDVPPEVAQQFRALMEAPDTGMHTHTPNQASLDVASQVRKTDAVSSSQSAHVDRTHSTSQVSMQQGDPTQAPELPTMVELLQTQARVSMFVFESKFLSSARSQTVQAMEQQLKSNS